jgi:hypothetical protein
MWFSVWNQITQLHVLKSVVFDKGHLVKLAKIGIPIPPSLQHCNYNISRRHSFGILF